jgi:hypothetical protein
MPRGRSQSQKGGQGLGSPVMPNAARGHWPLDPLSRSAERAAFGRRGSLFGDKAQCAIGDRLGFGACNPLAAYGNL